jgi:hypothetical protein
MADGPWTVWGDAVEPVLSGVDHETMKAAVDAYTTDTLYGEHKDTGDTYEG